MNRPVPRRRAGLEPASRQPGFTLLEVLVALAVLAIALGALVTASGENADNAAALRERTLAHWVALNQAAALELREPWPAVGTLSGTEQMAQRTWHWRAYIKETEDDRVRRVVVEVRGDEHADAPLAQVTAFLGDGGNAPPPRFPDQPVAEPLP